MLEVAQCLQHPLKMTAGDLVVEALGKGLQIDVGRVDDAIELAPRLITDVACRHCDRFDPQRMAGLCRIDGVFMKNNRIIIGKGDAPAVEALRSPGDRVGQSDLRQGIHFTRLADLPVLAEAAGKVAASRPEGERGRPGQEMVQRFFLDRVNAKTAGAPVGRKHDLAALPGPHKTQSPLPLVQLAEPRTEIALDPPILKPVPVARRNDRTELIHDPLPKVSFTHRQRLAPPGGAAGG